MNENNNKSPNKNDSINENSNKKDDIIDISKNILFKNTFTDLINFKEENRLHDGVVKSVEEIIDDMCREFDEILKITSKKTHLIDQSYNNFLVKDQSLDKKTEDVFLENIKHNDTYFIMNKNENLNTNVTANFNNKKRLSYYLNSYDTNYNNIKRQNDKTLTNTLLDINQTYKDFSLKQHSFLRLSSTIPKPIVVKKKKVDIKITLNNIGDLIKLADDYPLSPMIEYNIDMEAIHLIRPDIVRLNDMIGMHNLKENILDQILYFIQKLHIHKKENINNEFMHTVIYGPPGTGKTETAHIIGGIYSKLGILKNKVFKKVTRTDLIAGYLGQTAIKTTEVIKSAIGGVLFIDEAYALGNVEKKDSFAKECIDTLCEALSNHKHELMVIIAGYEEDLKKCFFSYNQGLDSRFIWRFKINDYNSKELQLIFNKKVNDCGWSINKIPNSWFEKHKKYFKYFGRDMETLLSKVKIAHSRRVFCLSEDEKRKITIKDIKKGFKLYLKNEEVKSRVESNENPLVNMYL